MKSRVSILICASVLIFNSLLLSAQITNSDFEREFDFDTELEKTSQLIVMLKADYDGVEEFGAGIIFGRQKDRLLIATAYHILHRGDSKPGKIFISVKALPDKFFEATILKHGGEGGLDLAVVEASNLPRQGFNVCSLSFDRLGNVADLKRRDSVYPIGNPNGVPWAIPPEADKISAITGNNIIFQSSFISSGHSGGGLLDKNATLVGMTVADQPPFGRVINIDAVLKQVRLWGYLFQLLNVLPGGTTPLHAAAGTGDTSAMENILQVCNSNVNVTDGDEATPLHYAAHNGRVGAISLLLKAGAKINAPDAYGDPPVKYALDENHFEAVKLLVKAGAGINIKNRDGRAAVYWAQSAESLQFLINAGADVNIGDNYGYTPLQNAATAGDIERIKLLIKSGADVNKSNKSRATPLINAVKKQSEEGMNILLKAGANVNAKGDFGYTPLMTATISQWKTGVKTLLKAGADIHATSERGDTALSLAISHSYPEMADLLRSLGAKY